MHVGDEIDRFRERNRERNTLYRLPRGPRHDSGALVLAGVFALVVVALAYGVWVATNARW